MSTHRLRLAALLPLFLAACGGSSAPPPTTAAPAPPTTAARVAPVSTDTAAPYVPTGDGTVHVTSVTKSGTVYEIVLNGVVRIPGVRIIDGVNGKFLGFPERVAPDDPSRKFDYVFVDRTAGAGLVAEVEAGRGVPGNVGFTISKAEVRAHASGKGGFVTFFLNDGVVKLYSWRLIDGANGLWLAPPSEKVGNDFQDILSASDPDFKKALENAAIEAFRRG